MTEVSVRDISVAFGTTRVFDGLDIDIGSGEFVVLLGPSGCGKSHPLERHCRSLGSQRRSDLDRRSKR